MGPGAVYNDHPAIYPEGGWVFGSFPVIERFAIKKGDPPILAICFLQGQTTQKKKANDLQPVHKLIFIKYNTVSSFCSANFIKGLPDHSI